jgi:hypothetical protein
MASAKNKDKSLFLLFILIIYFVSCGKNNIKTNDNGNYENDDAYLIEETLNNENKVNVKIDTIPTGSACFIDGSFIGITPFELILSDKKYNIHFDRVRFFSEDFELDLSGIDGSITKKYELEKNQMFNAIEYLAYEFYQQADGVGRYSLIYVYDEKAELVKIEDYLNGEVVGHYELTIDNNGKIISKVYYSEVENKIIRSINYFYNDNGILEKDEFESRSVIGYTEYFYEDTLLYKTVTHLGDEEHITLLFIQEKQGDYNSYFVREIIEKDLQDVQNLSVEEQNKLIQQDFLAVSTYIYQ